MHLHAGQDIVPRYKDFREGIDLSSNIDESSTLHIFYIDKLTVPL
jgi:hypothetical protein